MRKFNRFLNVLIGAFFGMFVGQTFFSYREHLRVPELGMRSAPWYYYEPLSSFLLFLAVVVICVILKIIIRRMGKNDISGENMITLFNRREVLLTMDLKKQADVRGILSANNIPYVTKTTNLLNSQAVGSHRGKVGSLGINQDYCYEYKIYVHKKDYDKALSLIR